MGGSSKGNCNVMNLFTEEMKGWFEKVLDLHLDEEEHPIDFSERFVLAMDQDTDHDTAISDESWGIERCAMVDLQSLWLGYAAIRSPESGAAQDSVV